jgi:hypothetical protein
MPEGESLCLRARVYACVGRTYSSVYGPPWRQPGEYLQVARYWRRAVRAFGPATVSNVASMNAGSGSECTSAVECAATRKVAVHCLRVPSQMIR